MSIRFQDGKGEKKMKIKLGNIDVDKIEKYLARSITLTIDEGEGKPKKIQTNSLYGELRGKDNAKQK